MYPNLLVLEAAWDDGINDPRTVRPFIEGWGAHAGVTCAFRYYNARDDLRYWLELFYRDPFTDTLYIAGHGSGTRLVGLRDRGINIATLLAKVFSKRGRPRDVNPKGILIGACECFGPQNRKRTLQRANTRLQWLAGYAVRLPWLESTLIDLAVLEYLFRGRAKSDALARGQAGTDNRNYGSLGTLTQWIWRDFPLAKGWEFGVETRPARRGK